MRYNIPRLLDICGNILLGGMIAVAMYLLGIVVYIMTILLL